MIPREREALGLTSQCFKKEGAHFSQLGNNESRVSDLGCMLLATVDVWLWIRGCPVNFINTCF